MAQETGRLSVSQKNKTVRLGEKTFPFAKGMTGKNVNTINNTTYVDGFELIDGQWKKTLKAFLYKYF